jgi:hypothetical protein
METFTLISIAFSIGFTTLIILRKLIEKYKLNKSDSGFVLILIIGTISVIHITVIPEILIFLEHKMVPKILSYDDSLNNILYYFVSVMVISIFSLLTAAVMALLNKVRRNIARIRIKIFTV